MPSASAKLEKQTSFEVLDPMKQVLNILEKKVRNLEKRKAKLDAYKLDFSQGKELNDDQKNAIEKYNEVIQTLDFSKDLQKSFVTIFQDSTKLLKKQAKRDQTERLAQDHDRMRNLLVIQDVLNNMGLEHVRNSFLRGTHGAPMLTEENLTQLDELYKLISPSRDQEDDSYDEQVNKSADHLLQLLDSKPKEILSSTYKDLRELILKIHESGFLSSTYALQKGQVNGEESEDDVPENSVKGDYTDDPEEDYAQREAGTTNDSVVNQAATLDETTALQQQQQQPPPPPPPQQQQQQPQQQQQQPQRDPTPPIMDTYFATPYQPTHARPEGATQGNFNFLQESQIDVESYEVERFSPHMDSAVVAAHPMTPQAAASLAFSSQTQDSLSSAGTGYTTQHPLVGTQARGPSPQPPTQYAASQTNAVPVVPQTLMTSQIPIPPSDYSQPIPTQTFTNQNYVTLPGLQSPATYANQTLFHAQMDTETLQQQQQQQQQNQQQQQQVASSNVNDNSSSGDGLMTSMASGEPKKHYMNVNAAAFESVSYKQPNDVRQRPGNANEQHQVSSQSSGGTMGGMMSAGNTYSELTTSHRQSPPSETSTSAPGGYPHSNLNQPHTFQTRTTNFASNNNNNNPNSNPSARGSRGGGGRGHRGSANGYNNRGGGGARGGGSYNNANRGMGGYQGGYPGGGNNYFQNSFQQQQQQQRENNGGNGSGGFGGNFSNGGGGNFKRAGGTSSRGRNDGSMRGGTGNRGSSLRGGSSMRGRGGGVGYPKTNQS